MTKVYISHSSSGSASGGSTPEGSSPRSNPDVNHQLAKDRNGHLVPRQRKWAPKKRTGCLTCRSRHLKCDEAKPSCTRCKLAGKVCDGYLDSSPPKTASAPVKIRRLKHRLSPEGVNPSPRDWQMFDLFRTVTVQQISGGVDLPFWSVDLLRAAQTYPAIWHATLALASMHEWMKLDAGHANIDLDLNAGGIVDHRAEQAQEHYTFALAQYNASISHVLGITRQSQDLSYAAKETLLMTSMLYAGICCMQNKPSQAMVHIRNAVEIFGQWRFWEQLEDESELESKLDPELEPKPKAKSKSSSKAKSASKSNSQQRGILNPDSLAKLVTTSYYQLRDLASDLNLESLAVVRRPKPISRCKKPFTSPTQAYYEFLTILHMEAECPDCDPSSSDPISCPSPQLPRCGATSCRRHVFNYWKTRFVGLQETFQIKTPSSPSSPPSKSNTSASSLSLSFTESQDQQTMQLLTIFKDLFECLFFDLGSASRARVEAKFNAAIDAAEQLLQQQAASSSTPLAPIYSYSLSILEVLTGVGVVSRNSHIRRRVMDLMDAYPRRDGVASSHMLRLVIETIMYKEEGRGTRYDAGYDYGGWAMTDWHDGGLDCGCEPGLSVCAMHKVEDVAISFLDDRMIKIAVRNREEVMAGLPPTEIVQPL